nr:exo-alpha-sialidase [Actinomycetota bacterium]
AHNSPTIAVNPDDEDVLVVVDKIDRPSFAAAIHRSEDGGESWSEAPFPIPSGEDRPYAPDLVWGADKLYLSFVTLTGRGNNPEAIWLSTSDDAGVTWNSPQQVFDRSYAFQVRMASDTSGRLYLTWLQGAEETTGTLSFTAAGLPIVAAFSDDEGESWSEPVQVSSSERERVGAAVPVAGSEGDLYVLFFDYKDDRFDWENLEGDVYAGTFELVLAHGDVEGGAFEESVVEAGVVPYERFLVYLPKFPSLAMDPSSSVLYAGWSDARDGDPDVFVRRSEDGGATWSEPVRIHESSPRAQYLATLDAVSGRLDALYLDRRADPADRLTAAFFASSTDEGRTWSDLEVASESFNSRLGPEGIPGQPDQGTRVGLASTETAAFAVWTDARRSSKLTGTLDIFFAKVAFKKN